MGQPVNPNGAIFLSAGVPDSSAKHFVAEADSAAISAAVSALIYVTMGRRRLVWGGHPAITPMIWAYAEAMEIDYGAWVKLYQSAIFDDEFPAETKLFQNVVVTPTINGDRDRSLALMRERMMEETDFAAAVFVGGMQGILDEYSLFRDHAPNAVILPIMSTGGAAEVLGREIDADVKFAEELDYIALLHEALEIDPNERRYASPQAQPAQVEARIIRPSASGPDE